MIVRAKKDTLQFSKKNTSSFSARANARTLTAAFRSDDLPIIIESFRKILGSQKNISEVARNTTSSRTTLYHAFTLPHIPRVKTILSFLNAVGLQFSIEPITTANLKPRKKSV
jgi:DNA-binding phage protein